MDREHTRPLQDYRGSTERPRPIRTLKAPHPYSAEITITPLQLNGYAGARFEVATRWLGPKLPGTPDVAGGGLVHGNDVHLVDELELAERVARRAEVAFARGEVPELRELARQLLERVGS